MPEPTSDRPTLRSRLAEVFRTDAELTGFCIDDLLIVADQFAAGMNGKDDVNKMHPHLSELSESHGELPHVRFPIAGGQRDS